ncbi:MAG: TatD family hydrolase [Gammaproteobacteria bacterium]|nr:TatD family hydrolase [Gammaproteobacteria bacterium]
MYLVDSHCHLDQLDLSKYEGKLEHALAFAQEKNVKHMLCVCITLAEFPNVLKIAKSYPNVSASVGLHPNEIVDQEPTVEQLVSLARDEKIVAIGETGLDYFRSTGDVEWQRQRFRTHIQAAKEINKPLIVHTRAAKADTLRVLKEENANDLGGVMHCFTEDWETAKAALDLNFYISISGIVTFKSATEIQEVAKRIPLDRLLIETDSPYLAPNPFRGKSNEPAYVLQVAEYIAQLRGIELEELATQTSKNFFSLFKGALCLDL